MHWTTTGEAMETSHESVVGGRSTNGGETVGRKFGVQTWVEQSKVQGRQSGWICFCEGK